MASEIELKPCPFCGGKARMEASAQGFIGVACRCAVVMFLGREYDTRKAAEAWNRRAGD